MGWFSYAWQSTKVRNDNKLKSCLCTLKIWETTASFFNEVDNLRENKYKDDPEMLEKIEGYNNHVMEIQSRFENA